ncbi:hypothetical protein QBC44DRAFT_378823 [Cladorrhinum sp. PSN332]|nr:hypothetical protein QBC44DRAFT_378823 [Cladorrhinum sp. PSN332]
MDPPQDKTTAQPSHHPPLEVPSSLHPNSLKASDSLAFEQVTWNLVLKYYADLCDSCGDALRGDIQLGTYIQKDLTEGCPFCDAIWESCTEVGKGCSVCTGEDNFDVICAITNRTSSTLGYTLEHYVYNDFADSTFRTLSIRQSAGFDCGVDTRILSFIRSKLESCLEHSSCQELVNSRSLPAASWPGRMIKILDDSIRVVPFDTATMIGEYAALSYCWGPPSELKKNPPYRMTTSTMSKLQSESGALMQEMPLTIQQAFKFCKVLDIDYIWVDSLCILQAQGPNDLPAIKDWHVESPKMETVYSRSKLTIIAACGVSCHSGFLTWNIEDGVTVMESVPMPHGLRLVGQEGQDAFRRIRSGFHHNNLYGDKNPLSLRGWGFQEEILSSRYIKFTDDDVQWKCKTATGCMCGEPPNDGYLEQWDDAESTSLDPVVRWCRLVEMYSGRSVTVESDRLVAISGLARITEGSLTSRSSPGHRKVEYHAGIWQGVSGAQLAYQLSWHSSHSGGDETYAELGGYQEKNLSPSFSWASVQRTARPHYDPRANGADTSLGLPDLYLIPEIIDIQTTPTSQNNIFGAVSSGFMRLRGRVRRFVVWCEQREGHDSPTLYERDCGFDADQFYARPAVFDCSISQITLKNGKKSVRRSETLTEFDETEVKMLLLASPMKNNAAIDEDVTCLLLARQDTINGESVNGYQRIGLIVLSLLRASRPVEDLSTWGEIEDLTIY